MQSTINLPTLTPIRIFRVTKSPTHRLSLRPIIFPKRLQNVKTTAADSDPSPTVDYTSMTSSVFPAEACETIGGDACEVEMYPEVKLETSQPQKSDTVAASESVDREYLQYDGQKTVFPGEACDDLGGEFCDPEYQTGVY